MVKNRTSWYVLITLILLLLIGAFFSRRSQNITPESPKIAEKPEPTVPFYPSQGKE